MATQYRSATDKNQQGIAYQIARLWLEYGLVPDDLKRDRKLLREIHGWIRAENPIEDKQPEECKESLSELIEINSRDFTNTTTLTFYSDYDIQILTPEEKGYYRDLLDSISDRMKEITKRGKLIDSVQVQSGSPLPL